MTRFARYCLPDNGDGGGGLTARHAITAKLIDTIERKKEKSLQGMRNIDLLTVKPKSVIRD